MRPDEPRWRPHDWYQLGQPSRCPVSPRISWPARAAGSAGAPLTEIAGAGLTEIAKAAANCDSAAGNSALHCVLGAALSELVVIARLHIA